MKEFNLSEKIHCAEHCDNGVHEYCVRVIDVKEFVRLLKETPFKLQEVINDKGECSMRKTFLITEDRLDKLAGDDLTK